MRARSGDEFLGLGVLQIPEASDSQNIALPDVNKSPDVIDFAVGRNYAFRRSRQFSEAIELSQIWLGGDVGEEEEDEEAEESEDGDDVDGFVWCDGRRWRQTVRLRCFVILVVLVGSRDWGGGGGGGSGGRKDWKVLIAVGGVNDGEGLVVGSAVCLVELRRRWPAQWLSLHGQRLTDGENYRERKRKRKIRND